MSTRAVSSWMLTQPLTVTAALIGLAYLCLRGHATGHASFLSLRALSYVIVVGGVLSFAGLAIVLARLVRDRTRYRLGLLVQSYASIVLLFAGLFALLQTSSTPPAFHGMQAFSAAAWGEGASPLNAIVGDSLYLSVVTITTVGYGDVVPAAPTAKLLVALEGLAGIAFMGLALGHYFSVCSHCASPGESNSGELQP